MSIGSIYGNFGQNSTRSSILPDFGRFQAIFGPEDPKIPAPGPKKANLDRFVPFSGNSSTMMPPSGLKMDLFQNLTIGGEIVPLNSHFGPFGDKSGVFGPFGTPFTSEMSHGVNMTIIMAEIPIFEDPMDYVSSFGEKNCGFSADFMESRCYTPWLPRIREFCLFFCGFMDF